MLKIAKIIFSYCKICISFKEKCKYQVSLTAFGFDAETIHFFSNKYVLYNDDKSQMKIDPRISSVYKRDGDEFINSFEILVWE